MAGATLILPYFDVFTGGDVVVGIVIKILEDFQTAAVGERLPAVFKLSPYYHWDSTSLEPTFL